jgi:uncharacterized protein (TIGR02145 family)/prepilin-type N-terminal cleavage/methylation domain-containing protein
MNIRQRGFTLVELLVVIGVLVVLVVVAVLALNPAQLLMQSRDSNRVSALSTVNTEIAFAQSRGLSLGTPNIAYVSIPDPTLTGNATSNCASLGLPTIASTTYQCVSPANVTKLDGTGWIPVVLNATPVGTSLGALPLDPVNTTSSGEYYIYTTNGTGYELMAKPEAAKNTSSTSFAQGTNLALLPSSSGSGGSSFTCGSPLVDARDSQSYTTVQIGTQCWMQQNLNVGTEIAGATNQGTDVSSATSIQKYCYNDATSSCTTYGALYQWTQAVGGSAGCDGTGVGQPACTTPIQGVCPANWHIPSHYEWTELELTTCTSGTCSTDFPYDETTQGWQGTNEGTTLQSPTGLFRGLLAGSRDTDGSFGGQGSHAFFWSSLASGGSAWFRYLHSGDATIARFTGSQANGFSVRCVKN